MSHYVKTSNLLITDNLYKKASIGVFVFLGNITEKSSLSWNWFELILVKEIDQPMLLGYPRFFFKNFFLIMIIKPINIKLTSERKQFSTPSQVHLVGFFPIFRLLFFSGETFYTIFSQQCMNFYHHKSSSSPKKLFLYL